MMQVSETFLMEKAPSSVLIVGSTLCSGVDQTSKLLVTGLCEGNPMVTSGFPSQRASNVENVFIWWSNHAFPYILVLAPERLQYVMKWNLVSIVRVVL